MIPFIQIHQADGPGIEPDSELWVNLAHIISVVPVFGNENARVHLTDNRTITTVESYRWIVTQITDTPPDNAFGSNKHRK